MVEGLVVPCFDGTNMDVQDWLHCFLDAMATKGIWDSVSRLSEASLLLRGEAYQWWIQQNALNRAIQGVYNSNEFCYDLCERFYVDDICVHNEKVLDAQNMFDEVPQKTVVRVGDAKIRFDTMAEGLVIPCFDGTNMDVQDWLHCYHDAMDKKGIWDCVSRLFEASLLLRGEAYQWWIQQNALNRAIQGVYNSNDFCYDLFKRFHVDDICVHNEKVLDAQNMFDEMPQKTVVLVGDANHNKEDQSKFKEHPSWDLTMESIKIRSNQIAEESHAALMAEMDKILAKLGELNGGRQEEVPIDLDGVAFSDTENLSVNSAAGFCDQHGEASVARDLFDEMPLKPVIGQSLPKDEEKSKPVTSNDTGSISTKCSNQGLLGLAVAEPGFCSVSSVIDDEGCNSKPLYWKVTNPSLSPSHLQDLPGFTRSVYKKDHALITPESHVFSPIPEWSNTLGAYLITPAMGSHFIMYLAKMQENSKSGLPPNDVERLIFVVQGSVLLSNASDISHKLEVDSYAYLPPKFEHSIKCDASATLVVFERRYAFLENYVTELIVGSTDKQPLLETPGEVFELRKLLPQSLPYDFNIHIMDFQPGEFLNVKEVHYNQHGLLLLEGQGIYRLGDSWYPVQAGDVIWMAPFVPQWYAALGKTRSRYLLYKDVNRNPL